ncbi:uncharacterized protein BO87DRAFT_188008 [Aspergillus neoniger CBS 115656]|uniref:Uncharacterized protein n=1 Tax=Aspergillus neoniger (strain CBS 115656) TaxID=1448310 RepID=A0A318YT19_ASPNB|nr:hypothetical protein BO87DRAFT_188008 [Aspergillus neoniger CBS 115656]PYH37885.1 hypothetical protein BO87DRAFT_188008 [Aspergillus neoniger CBS 115656]
MASRASGNGAEGLQCTISLHELSETKRLNHSINTYYLLLSPFMLSIPILLPAHQLNNGIRYRPLSTFTFESLSNTNPISTNSQVYLSPKPYYSRLALKLNQLPRPVASLRLSIQILQTNGKTLHPIMKLVQPTSRIELLHSHTKLSFRKES